MALTLTKVLDASASNPATYSPSGFSVPDNCLLTVVAGVLQTAPPYLTPDSSLTCTASGLTFTPHVGCNSGDGTGGRMFTAPVTTGGTVNLTLALSGADAMLWKVQAFTFEDYDTGSPTGATASKNSAATSGADSMTLSGTPASSSIVLAADVYYPTSGTVGAAAGTGFTEEYDSATAYNALQTQSRTGSTSTTVPWASVADAGDPSAIGSSLMALEIKAAGGPPPASTPSRLLTLGVG